IRIHRRSRSRTERSSGASRRPIRRSPPAYPTMRSRCGAAGTARARYSTRVAAKSASRASTFPIAKGSIRRTARSPWSRKALPTPRSFSSPTPRTAFVSIRARRDASSHARRCTWRRSIDRYRGHGSLVPSDCGGCGSWRTSGGRASDGASAAPRNAQRKARVLATIDRNGLGVEIGPSHDPIAPKRDGFKVHVIDHASREELIAKYATHGIALDRIEDVDFVWKGESYLELTGKPKHYDWIIGSHLIEHTPALIAFLASCDSILKDGGVLSLVIPDKRYCFDCFRPITGLARVIDSHLAGNKIHSEGTVAEFCMNVAAKGNTLSWDERSRGDYRLLHSVREAEEAMREVRKHAYVDVHNWCFVPH